MSESESKLNAEAVVYFVISPLQGPAYRLCGNDDLQAVGGVARAVKKVHELVEVTAVRFWYDSLWLSKPVPIDELVLAEYSFRIPLQLRWAADHRLISVQILRTASC
jgi:hypothetical protein